MRKTALTLLFLLLVSWMVFKYFFISDSNDPLTVVKKTPVYQPNRFPKATRIDLAFQQEHFKTADPRTNTIPRERLSKGRSLMVQKLKALKGARKAVNLTWEERGPYNIGGRTKAILWDPNDPSNTKAWAGAASGGLWYNNDVTNTSSEWVAVDDLMENLSISSIVYDPVNSNTMYIGTGEGHIIGSVRGAGMFKSTDGGVTWTHMTTANGFYDTENEFHYVNDIIVKDEGGAQGVIYVATQESLNNYTSIDYSLSGERGLWRSTDGGVNFTRVITNYSIGDLEIDGAGRIYAGTARDLSLSYNAQIFYSDNGTTWNTAYDFGGGDRVELAIAPSNDDHIYAVAANGGSVYDMVSVSANPSNSSNWSSITIPEHYDPSSFGGSCGVICNASGDFTRSSQAFYDLILRVDPTDEDKVWVGGIDLHQSTDGGNSWDQKTTWFESGGNSCFCLPYVHADMHVLEFNPADPTQLLNGSDGGVAITTDANAATPSWSNRNNNYNVTQFYGGAINPTGGSNQFLAGSQDNGTQYFNGSGMVTTSEASGGDGAFCNIDANEPQYQWTQYVYNNYYRSTNTGVSFSGVPEFGSSTGRFINPSAYDDSQNIMYAAGGSNQFLRWTDPQSGNTGGFISTSFGGAQVSSLLISPNVSNRVYFGTGASTYGSSGGELFYIDNAHNSSTATNISGSGFPSKGYLSSIAVEQGNEDHIVVTFSNYGVSSVWETTNGGSTWTDIEGDLPDMPVRWAIIHPEDAERIILATELGVWSTDQANGASTEWDPHSDESFPHVRTDMLQVRATDNEMIALTHGRGLWSADITLPTTSDPEIAFSNSGQTQTETTSGSSGCLGYEDYSISMEIANPPNGDATVTLSVDGASTASQGYDFDFTTTDFTTTSNTLTFADGTTTNQNFTVRVFDDAADESEENIIFNYTISGTTDAIAGSNDQTYTFSIQDNDEAPEGSTMTYLMQEDFEGYANYTALTNAGWAQYTFDGSAANGNQWRHGNAQVLSGSNSVYVSQGTTNTDYNANSTSNVVLVTPLMDATGLSDISLSFDYQCNGEFLGTYYDYGNLYYAIDTNDDGDVSDESFTPFENQIQGITSTTTFSEILPSAVNGQSFALGFHWQNDGTVSNQPAFIVDNIEISSGTAGTNIASTASQTYETNFGPNETVHFYDASGDIIMTLENLSSWDYGCTEVTVATDGTTSMAINETTSAYFPASKTFTVTPDNNNSNGSYHVQLYYTADEINGWASATGMTLGDMDLVKVEGTLDSDVLANDIPWETATTSYSSLGSNYVVDATFNTGFSSFGITNSSGWPTPLPVDLMNFNARPSEKGILVSWQTASEKNADFFEVQHSTDGTHFKTIGSLQSAGNSNEILQYSFIHVDPKTGMNYYRLKQVDFDGSFEYSHVEKANVISETFGVTHIYPNPARKFVHLEFISELEASLELYATTGHKVFETSLEAAPNGNTTRLDVSNLKRGMYLLRMSDGHHETTQRIILK